MKELYLERARQLSATFGGNGLTTNQQINNAAELLQQWAVDDGTEYDKGILTSELPKVAPVLDETQAARDRIAHMKKP